MKTFYLNFEMNKDSGKFQQFINDIEEYEQSLVVSTDEGNFLPIIGDYAGVIYVDSPGGQNCVAAIMYDFLKNRPLNYKYVVTGSFSSNAILLLLALNPKDVVIMRQASSVIHLSNYNHPVSTLAFAKDNDPNINDFSDFIDYLNELMLIYKAFLSKEEIKLVEKGFDVVLGAKRINELFLKLKRDKKFQKQCKNIFEITL